MIEGPQTGEAGQLSATIIAVADQLAAAAGLAMGKADGGPGLATGKKQVGKVFSKFEIHWLREVSADEGRDGRWADAPSS